MSFTHIQTNTENAQIAAVRAVDQLAQAVFDDFGTRGDQFEEEQDNDKSQPVQFEYGAQVSAFQVKAIVFEVTKHFFNGLITNDKFCMTRVGQLRLNHWRRPLRLRK